MQRSGGAAIPMKEINNIRYLAGGPIEKVVPLRPYDDLVCDFLAALSRNLLKDKRTSAYPDVLSFAFFCRKANIFKLKSEFEDKKVRIGKGLVFHIAPSNIPVNCAFTYVFGLLAGNANVVRVSSKNFEQVNIICDVMQKMFDSGEYDPIRDMTAFVTYEHDKSINDALSMLASARVIWGGDRTIAQLRQSPISSRCTEITFADRYSFAVIDPEAVADGGDDAVKNLAHQYYNDTYLMDQNACSTPHLIVWKTAGGAKAAEGKKLFWQAVYQEAAAKYDLADIKVSDKYVMLCKYAIEMDSIKDVRRFNNLLYLITLDHLPEDMTTLRGRFGLFFQYDVKELDELASHIDRKVQTCVYYGVEREDIQKFVLDNHLLGVDRIVPVGSSLDIGVIWDGYDIVGQLSRIVG